MFRKAQQPFDEEKFVGNLLLSLPRCPNRVVAFDSALDPSFDCAFIAHADDLLIWLNHHFAKVTIFEPAELAARKAFIIWLQAADRSDDDSIVRIPKVFFDCFSAYATDLVSNISGHVYCPHCETGHRRISVTRQGSDRAGDWFSEDEIWTCPKGHQLRKVHHEFHINFRR